MVMGTVPVWTHLLTVCVLIVWTSVVDWALETSSVSVCQSRRKEKKRIGVCMRVPPLCVGIGVVYYIAGMCESLYCVCIYIYITCVCGYVCRQTVQNSSMWPWRVLFQRVCKWSVFQITQHLQHLQRRVIPGPDRTGVAVVQRFQLMSD